MLAGTRKGMALEKMNDKLKNRILRLTNMLIVSLMIVVGMACCGSLAVYGAEEGLTEEEVKQQVLEIITAEGKEEVTKYTIVEYDIEEIYPLVSLDFFVNDYIDGMTFEQIIDERKKIYMELNERDSQYTSWLLPYRNNLKQQCFATFLVDCENVEIFSRTIDVDVNFDMKLFDGKFKELDLKRIKEIVYLNLELYGFKATYVIEDDGEEYVIPYLYEEIKERCGLENERIYIVDEFITIMYNTYEESEIEKKIQGMANPNMLVSARKRKLECADIEQVRKIEWIKEKIILILSILILSIIGINLIVRVYRKKRV